MPGRRVDPLAALVAASILALGLYVGTLPTVQVIAPEGAVFVLDRSGDLYFNFTVHGEGGHLLGAYTSTNETMPWVHPASTWGVIPRGPAQGVCAGRFDSVLPPDSYVLTFFGEAGLVRITESFRVDPARAPSGALGYATAGGTLCPLPAPG